MRKSNIKINRYKSSGKWIETLDLETELDPWSTDEIIREIEDAYEFLKKENYTVEITRDNLFNKRLIINSL